MSSAAHLSAVVEHRIVAQLVGVGEPAVGHGNACRQLEHRLVGGRIPLIEAAVDQLRNDAVLGARRCMDIETRETGAVRRRHSECSALAGRRGLRVCCDSKKCQRQCRKRYVFHYKLNLPCQ